MLFRWLMSSFGATLVLLFSGLSASAADATLTPDEFLKIYRAAVNKQIAEIVDFEIDTVEKNSASGKLSAHHFCSCAARQ